jgi:5'-nucleotidase
MLRIATFAGLTLTASLTSSLLAGDTTFRLTVLHSNDGESKLISPGPALGEFGGIARFGTLVNQLRDAAALEGGVVMLSSGDNFLAGPEFNASLENGVPFYDAIGLELVGYDAICIGNHEFDFGPDTFADFVSSFTDGVPFLSANLNYAGEPNLVALESAGRLKKSTIVTTGGRQVGIVAATTPDLPFISSPGAVVASPAIKDIVQAEVDALTAQGVNIIILMTHLQGISSELALIPQLRNVDVVIAGGGDELLANPGTLLVPDDAVDANNNGIPDLLFGPYPLTPTDADGKTVRVITTRGDYRYVGRLAVDFDMNGEVVGIDTTSGPVRVAATTQTGGVVADPAIQAQVTNPVAAAVAALAANIIATSEVPLNGVNAIIRSQETNLGNLCADSLLWQATAFAKANGGTIPQIAVQNGGGIRNNNILPAGPFSELLTFSIFPFANFVVTIPDVPATTIKSMLENAVSRVSPPPGFTSSGNGRFAQIAGFRFSYEVDRNPGTRVRDVILDDGTVLVEDGVVISGAPAVDLATINFLATGGDQYPLNGLAFENTSLPYQQALLNYVVGPLGGLISAAQYPVGGEGRIQRIDNPADLDNNSVINANDLSILIGQWGGPGTADLNGDGIVNGADLAVLLGNWSA